MSKHGASRQDDGVDEEMVVDARTDDDDVTGVRRDDSDDDGLEEDDVENEDGLHEDDKEEEADGKITVPLPELLTVEGGVR